MTSQMAVCTNWNGSLHCNMTITTWKKHMATGFRFCYACIAGVPESMSSKQCTSQAYWLSTKGHHKSTHEHVIYAAYHMLRMQCAMAVWIMGQAHAALCKQAQVNPPSRQSCIDCVAPIIPIASRRMQNHTRTVLFQSVVQGCHGPKMELCCEASQKEM